MKHQLMYTYAEEMLIAGYWLQYLEDGVPAADRRVIMERQVKQALDLWMQEECV